MANAGRHGVLVKSAVVMEQIGQIRRVAFDKTGMLTHGAPHLAGTVVLPGTGLDTRELLALAPAAENPSEHPLVRAVITAAHQAGLRLGRADDFTSEPGRMVSARVAGRLVQVGGPAISWPQPRDGHPSAATVTSLEEAGQTAVVVLLDGVLAGVLGIADQLRPAAASTVAAITALTGSVPVLPTGDNPRAAARLAGRVGISDVRAGLRPQEKADAVRALQTAGHRVLLAGDGVNDAPALATADTGIAMGRAGSDLALDTANAVIVRDELATVPAVIGLSRRARRVVIANLAITAAFITALVIWDLAGYLPLPLGVLGHEGSTVIVGLNGLRLLRPGAWPRALTTPPAPGKPSPARSDPVRTEAGPLSLSEPMTRARSASRPVASR